MVSAQTKIINPQGMHMRPAQVLVSALAPFKCDINIIFNGKSVNAKSILNLMTACIKTGSVIEVCCDGEDEAEALKTVVELVESGLGD